MYGFNLKVSYLMMSLIRELVKKERQRIWEDKYIHRIPKNSTPKQIEKYYKEIILDQTDVPYLPQGVCNAILKSCQELEDKIQKALTEESVEKEKK